MPSTYESISTTTLGSDVATISFSSIPSSYTNLVLVITGTISNASGTTMYLRFNSDTGYTYTMTRLYGDGNAAYTSTDSGSAETRMNLINFIYSGDRFFTKLNIFGYAGSTFKTLLSETAMDDNGGGSSIVDRRVAMWRSTSAVNDITFSLSGSVAKFATNTTATLYGILKA